MASISGAAVRPDPVARSLTTFLCCTWGYSFAYAFFKCILDGSGPLAMLAAALPLAAVWAALERKRWGRLVIIGQSMLAFGLFATILLYVTNSMEVWLDPGARNLLGCLKHALGLFGETPEMALAILLLSAVTLSWFCAPWVREDYETKKKAFLTPGQRVIAVSVLSIWGITMASTPTVVEARTPYVPLRTPRRLTHRY